jgi:hypothetical protein
MQYLAKWRVKRAQKGRRKRTPLRLIFLGTKRPQGGILPAAWIGKCHKKLTDPFQSGRMHDIQI